MTVPDETPATLEDALGLTPEQRQQRVEKLNAELARIREAERRALVPTTPAPSIAAIYDINGEWLVQRVDGCTCYGGRPYGHEPGCGWEPIAKVADMLEALGGERPASGGLVGLPAQTEKHSNEETTVIPDAAVEAALTEVWRFDDGQRNRAAIKAVLAAALPDLLAELRATEGDLGIAVHEATTARAECGKWLRAAGELAAQRQSVLDLCAVADSGALWFAANVRVALGVCVACGCDLGTTPLCPSCEQSIEASKRERP